jgi:hypothetical protein
LGGEVGRGHDAVDAGGEGGGYHGVGGGGSGMAGGGRPSVAREWRVGGERAEPCSPVDALLVLL